MFYISNNSLSLIKTISIYLLCHNFLHKHSFLEALCVMVYFSGHHLYNQWSIYIFLPEGTILGTCIFFLISMFSYKIVGFYDDEFMFFIFNVTKHNFLTHLLYTIFSFIYLYTFLSSIPNFIVWLFALKLSENEKVSWSYHEFRNFHDYWKKCCPEM